MSKRLVALFAIPEVKKYFIDQRIRWTFNLEKAPWWGGFFERLIKSVKRCLYKILRNARVTSEELYTVLTEIEATLNSRPLTFVSTEDLDEPVTPSHLIYGRRIKSLPDAGKPGEESRVEEMSTNKAEKRVRYLRTLKEHFWLRWKREYLLELRNAHRQRNKRQKGNIRVGDVVVIHDDNVKRVNWKLGKVERLIEGKDGAIRGAVVRKLTDKTGVYTEIRRPVQKLYPVELSDEENGYDTEKVKTEITVAEEDISEKPSESKNQRSEVRKRPLREAARKAQTERLELIESGLL